MRDRLAQFADRPDECWNWPGSRGNGNKYGWTTVSDGNGGKITKWTHRLAYELLVGPIPPGMTLDHLCLNPLCMNPRHLEVCTKSENSRRARAREDRSRCKRGHLKTDDNVYISRLPDGRETRSCKECCRGRVARQRARRSA